MAVQIFLDAIPGKARQWPGACASRRPRCNRCAAISAFLAPETLAVGDLVRAVKGADKARASIDARLFDRFGRTGRPRRTGQPGGSRSELQPQDKSFTDAELKAVADKVVAAAAKLGAALRGWRPRKGKGSWIRAT